jgi:hypothetical protein
MLDQSLGCHHLVHITIRPVKDKQDNFGWAMSFFNCLIVENNISVVCQTIHTKLIKHSVETKNIIRLMDLQNKEVKTTTHHIYALKNQLIVTPNFTCT